MICYCNTSDEDSNNKDDLLTDVGQKKKMKACSICLIIEASDFLDLTEFDKS